MIKDITFTTDPKTAAELPRLMREVARRARLNETEIKDFRIRNRSIDARGGQVKILVTVTYATGNDKKIKPRLVPRKFCKVDETAPAVVIVGAGPAGLFAALRCLELGLRPIVLERGRDVDSRRIDLAEISRSGQINPQSNYCFGEGGAGAFSDGKLYTRSKKRGNVEDVLQLFVQFGASEDILIDAHPHIGSDKLPQIIRNMRETIIAHGGEVRFETLVTGLIFDADAVTGVRCLDGCEYYGQAVLLAIGHSSRDTVRAIHAQGVEMEAKGIAVGVRLEHPQALIDRIQYHKKEGRSKYLPAAEYSFVTQAEGRGVYSFCMCPGGVIVPAGSAAGELVVNGMSASGRAGAFANSGMVVEIHPEDFPEYESCGPLGMLDFQEQLEQRFYTESGESINAPAQRMTDFVKGEVSETLPRGSYAPGTHPADFNLLLPDFIARRLRIGLEYFGQRCRGFMTPEGVMIGLESRTSSPVRIPRNREDYEHIGKSGLYPVGEGAGYAGGIVSAALDGINAVNAFYKKNR